MQHGPRLLSPMSNIVNPTEDLVTVLTVGKAQIFERLAPPLLTSQEPLFLLHTTTLGPTNASIV